MALDAPTDHQPPGWWLSLYPDAREAGGCFVSSRPPQRSYVARGHAADPERAAVEAGRRARTNLRRYCAANALNRLGTLTYRGEGCHDPRELRGHVGEFFRSLRAGLDGDALPYVWVPEWHKTGHGLHVHFAVGQFVRRSLIESAWGRGFVHIKLLGDLGVGAQPIDEARKAAGYLSKYVTKTFGDPASRVLGLHRYDIAEGFKPSKVRLYGTHPGSVIDQASEMLEARPSFVWSSEDEETWRGPPAIWAQWAGPRA